MHNTATPECCAALDLLEETIRRHTCYFVETRCARRIRPRPGFYKVSSLYGMSLRRVYGCLPIPVLWVGAISSLLGVVSTLLIQYISDFPPNDIYRSGPDPVLLYIGMLMMGPLSSTGWGLHGSPEIKKHRKKMLALTGQLQKKRAPFYPIEKEPLPRNWAI